MAISDSANLIQVSVSSGLDTNRVVSYRLSDDYSIHSIINYASSQDHLATISNTYYEDQGISDKYLLLSIPASTFSSGNCFGFYELYSQGPHALLDYSGLTSIPADGMIDVNITTAQLVNGLN